MSSSVPAGVDWLVQQIRAAAPSQVTVSDGWPATRDNDLIAVGITPDGDETTITADYAQLSGLDEETVTLPITVFARRTGADAASRVRQAAIGYVDLIRSVVAGDRRLGGAVNPGLPARVSGWRMLPTSEPRQAGEGRTSLITLTMTWQHRG